MMRNVDAYAYKNEERLMFGALFLEELCQYVYQETKLVISGGVARNRLLAKIGCGLNKPNKITVFSDKAVSRVSKTTEVTKIPGLGVTPAYKHMHFLHQHEASNVFFSFVCFRTKEDTAKKLLQAFNVTKIGQIEKVKYDLLEEVMGKAKAQQISSWALGQDIDPVVPKILKDHIQCNKPHGGNPLSMHFMYKIISYLFVYRYKEYWQTGDSSWVFNS